jgi:hypothetical protein
MKTKSNWIKEEKTIDPLNEHGLYEKTIQYKIDDPILRDFCSTFVLRAGKYVSNSPIKIFDTVEECQRFCEFNARSKIIKEIEKLEGMIKLLGF